jgi:hypothetical protein
MKYKIERVYRDESNLNFVIKFPKGKTITDISDIIFLVKELDADPLASNLLDKFLSESDITLYGKDIAIVKFSVTDYDNMVIDKLYRAALFCKWIGSSDFDENVERLFDFQLKQNFHNNN